MSTNLYVGNLNYSVTQEDLENLFAGHGAVKSAKLIMDRDTGRSKGFAFVEMTTSDEAQDAISSLDGSDFQGRNLRVNEAKPREQRPQRNNNRW